MLYALYLRITVPPAPSGPAVASVAGGPSASPVAAIRCVFATAAITAIARIAAIAAISAISTVAAASAAPPGSVESNSSFERARCQGKVFAGIARAAGLPVPSGTSRLPVLSTCGTSVPKEVALCALAISSCWHRWSAPRIRLIGACLARKIPYCPVRHVSLLIRNFFVLLRFRRCLCRKTLEIYFQHIGYVMNQLNEPAAHEVGDVES